MNGPKSGQCQARSQTTEQRVAASTLRGTHLASVGTSPRQTPGPPAKFFSTHVPVQELGSGFWLGFMLGFGFGLWFGLRVRVKGLGLGTF